MEAARIKSGLEAIRKGFSKLRNGIDSPEGIADELYAGGIISRYARKAAQEVSLPKAAKTRNLLDAVECNATSNPNAFLVFVEVLGEHRCYERLCTFLRRVYGKIRRAEFAEVVLS